MKKQRPSSFNYQQSAYGTWGCFKTPSGVVEFLETKARLGTGSTDPETRLTRFLKPVREALGSQEMDFNQLLQRDLDDHRVATELVPYLLRYGDRGPAFFPPIVAALLPFDGNQPLQDFPLRAASPLNEDDESFWKGHSFGNAFKFEKAVYEDGSERSLKIGKLSWNDERAKLVVIDGQHRAMALLAIFRTLDRWEGDGEKYKHFYEPAVQELLASIPADKRSQVFSQIELPVTILWFPELEAKPGSSHQRAARKLFVDVNKNARPPSASRVLLLSDASLSAILTRRVLNEFRNTGTDTLPIYAIEYDHPERDQAHTAKWSAASNVAIISSCVYRAVFGPAKYINELTARFVGKENLSEAAKFMQTTLRLNDLVSATIEDGDRVVRREDITNDNFPRSAIPKIEEEFAQGWGTLVVRMLSDLLPYKAHGVALDELRSGWEGQDSTSRLASDSIFEGVGMYWTLRDSYEHWRDRNRIRTQAGQTLLGKTDIVKAWEETERKRGEFEQLRAKHFLGSSGRQAVETSKGAYAVFCTNACQLGFVLAVRSLAHLIDLPQESVQGFIGTLISGANAGLAGTCPGEFGRLPFLWRDAPVPLNQIPKLDSPEAVYFRYFWLELFGTNEARSLIETVVPRGTLDSAIAIARAFYLRRLHDILRASLRDLHRDWPDPKINAEAMEMARKELAKSLRKWFGVSQERFDEWLVGIQTEMSAATIADVPSMLDNSESDSDESNSDGALSVDELIRDD